MTISPKTPAKDTVTTTKTVVGAVIKTSLGKILLLRRAPHENMAGVWEFPSGKLKEGEGIFDCLIRETEEETGLSLSTPQEWRELGSFSYGKTVQRNFLVLVEGEFKPTLSKEHDSYKWVELDSNLLDDTLSKVVYTI